MSSTPNPILSLLLARNSTVSVPERKLANELDLWLDKNYPLFRIWLTGTPSTAWTEVNANELKAALLEREGSRITSVRMLAMLAWAIAEANRQYQFKLIAPDVPALKLRPTNKWEKDVIEKRQHAEQIVECIENLILQSVQVSAAGQNYLPLVLLSTIAYGGSLNVHTLAAQVRTLADPDKHWTYFGNWPQIGLEIWCGKTAPPERRLWIPDAATALLLLRFGSHLTEEASSIINPDPDEKDFEEEVLLHWIWDHALSGLRQVLKQKGRTIRSLAALLDTMSTLYQRYIEPTTVSYMTRETLSSSVRIDTFARIHGFEFPKNDDQIVPPDPDRHVAAEDNEDDYALDNWKQDLRSAFKASKPVAVGQALDRLAATWTFAPGKRVAEFGAFLLSEKGAWGKRAALSTVRLHTRNIANLLCDLLKGDDPAKLPAADLSALYFDILEELSERPKRRLSVAHSITQFHFFLVSKHELDDIDYGELGLKDFAVGSANANIAVETEVARIREEIRRNTSFPDDPRVVKAAEVVFLVALRSPARHQEVENIRLNDILYEDPATGKIAELFLRPWGSHTLKSGASVRRIDVKTQFRPEERNAIKAWIKMRARKTDDLDANKRIFHWPGTNGGESSWDRIISVVFAAMREVTKDPSFRLHHLRHTACSKMFVEFMLRQFVLSGGKIKRIPEDRWPFQLLGGQSLRALMKKDARALCGTSSSTRKAQYATAQRLGHSGTEVGSAYYNHAFDGWQSFALENSPLAPKRSILVPLSGLSSSQASNIAKSKGLRALVERLIPPREQWCPAPSASQTVEKPDPWKSMSHCWDFLVRSTSCTTPAEQTKLAREFDLDPAKAARMIARAKKLRDLKAVRVPKFQMIKRGLDRLHVPPKPRLGQNKTLAPRLAEGMENALNEFHLETVGAVTHWINLAPASGIRLTFKNFDDALCAARQSSLLEHMGVPYRWVSYDPKIRSKSRAGWRKKIGIQSSIRIHIESAPKNAAGKNPESWLAIEPVLTASRGKGQRNGGEAFRFVMLMTAIDLA